jgi:hypothetical protein
MKAKLLFPLIALLVFTLPVNGAPDSTSPRVLFIGNSYTASTISHRFSTMLPPARATRRPKSRPSHPAG